MADAAEEKRQAAIAAASKKKAASKGKKGKEEERETPAPEEKPNGRSSQLKSALDEPVEEVEPKFDLFLPTEFSQALKRKFGRRFTFGPIHFNGLDQEFDEEKARQMVIDALQASEPFKSAGADVCVHGHKVQVKERTLRRGTSLLKHSRFLNNLEVVPIWPPEPEPVQQE